MVDYGSAFERPISDAKKLIIGIVLSLIPIVNFIAFGYILNSTKNPKGKLPEWKDWGDLFVKGLIAAVIAFIFILPAMLILMVTVGWAIVSAILSGSSPFNAAMFTNVGLGLLIGLLLLIGLSYILPAALINYSQKNKFSAGFDFAVIKKKAFKSDYFGAWFIGGIYMGILTLVLSFIPLIGMGVSSFIGGLTFYSLIGQAFKSR